MQQIINTNTLHFTYDRGPSFQFPNISLELGKHLLIVGPSGVGKTTLLHVLSGILPATNGSILINGTDIVSLRRKEMATFRSAYIGLIFQQYHFIRSLNLEDNLRLRQYYPQKSINKKRRLELIERLDLTSHTKKMVMQLSQGQKQRLSIALGLIHQPKVIFADEPTSNLDDANCSVVLKLLKEEAEHYGSSLVIITHDYRVKKHFANHIEL